MAEIKKIKLPNVVNPYDISDDTVREENRQTGAVNLLKRQDDFPSGEINGITVGLRDDGSFTVAGTSTADVSIKYCTLTDFPLGTYYATGCSAENYRLEFEVSYLDDPYGPVGSVLVYGGETVRLNIDGGNYHRLYPKLEVYIKISSGTTIAHIFEVVKPMMSIVPRSISEFVPYAMTNRQITEVLEDGVASSIAQLTDVSLSSLANNDTLVYNSTAEKWQNESGHVQTIELTMAQYEALTTEQKNDPHKVYYINDVTSTSGTINDNSVASDTLWSSQKVNNIAETMAQNGAHSLVNNKVESKVQNTITFTAHDDNSFTANGTATGTPSENYYIGGSGWQKCNLKIGETYIISSGLMSDIPGYVMWFVLGDSSGNVIAYKEVGVTEQSITVPSNTAQVIWYVAYTEGTVFNNVLFKPMVRLASDPSTTYTPYAMTNKELTERVYTGYGSIVSVPTDGTRYTVPSNGIITVAADTNSIITFWSEDLNAGWIISGTGSNGNTMTMPVFTGYAYSITASSGTGSARFIPFKR